MRSQPSDKQLSTLRFIQRFTDEHGAPPTMQEIADEFGITPPSVYQQIVLLEKRGLIERMGQGKSRGLRVAPTALDKVTPIEESREIPILGTVPAGPQLLSEEHVRGHLQVSETLARRGKLFALEVKGTSMINAGIESGDYVVVRWQPLAENGEIVVALIDGEATVKRLHMEHDHIELMLENPKLKPIVVEQGQEFAVVGKVVSVQRLKGRDE